MRLLRVLDRFGRSGFSHTRSSTPARPERRAPGLASHLRGLAARPGEKSGLALAGAALITTAASAQPPAHQAAPLSFQGYTGLFNTPSAEVTPFGVSVLQWSDQVELSTGYDRGENYLLSLGLFPHVELGGRIADNTDHDVNLFHTSFDKPTVRDLSFNAKVQSPWRLPGGASLAAGLQDPFGEAIKFESRYLVATQPWGPARLSLGVGRSDSPLGRLDGTFGGIEYDVTDWLGLVAEHDADTANAGLRLRHDGHLGRLPYGIDLALQARSADRQREDVFGALGVRFPIGLSSHASTPPAVARVDGADLPPRVEPSTPLPDIEPGEPLPEATTAALDRLLERLAAHGFENIHVGTAGDKILYLRLGNPVFNRNDMDALGVALGEAARTADGRYARIRLVLTSTGIPVTGIEAPAGAWRAWLEQDNPRPPHSLLRQTRLFDPARHSARINWYRRGHASGWLRPRFVLQPAIVYGVATEVGRFDYSLALRTEGRLPVWPGGQLVVAGTTNSTNSDSFREGGAFAAQRIEAGLTDAALQQAARLGPLFGQLSLGRFRRDYDGGLAEAYWHAGRARHRLGLRAGRFGHSDETIDDERELALASYRHELGVIDAAIELTGGQFWAQDEGWLLETHHHFRDTTITLFAKSTAADFVGIRFTVPLSPRRDMAARPVQLRGQSRWGFDLQTRVREDSNVVDFAIADAMRRPSDLDHIYLNDGRHGATYQQRHFTRMHEAFHTFDRAD